MKEHIISHKLRDGSVKYVQCRGVYPAARLSVALLTKYSTDYHVGNLMRKGTLHLTDKIVYAIDRGACPIASAPKIVSSEFELLDQHKNHTVYLFNTYGWYYHTKDCLSYEWRLLRLATPETLI